MYFFLFSHFSHHIENLPDCWKQIFRYGQVILYFTIVQMQHSPAGTADEFIIVGDDKNDFSEPGEALDQRCQPYHAVIVQAAGRFIEYQQLFSADHRDRCRQPLLLPAGERIRVALPEGRN